MTHRLFVAAAAAVVILRAPGSPQRAAAAELAPATIPDMVRSAAAAAGVPVDLALFVAARESGFDPNAVHENARDLGVDLGVFQLNSRYLGALGVTDPLDPRQNIEAGVGLLAYYLHRYAGDRAAALCAFARGPGACK